MSILPMCIVGIFVVVVVTVVVVIVEVVVVVVVVIVVTVAIVGLNALLDNNVPGPEVNNCSPMSLVFINVSISSKISCASKSEFVATCNSKAT